MLLAHEQMHELFVHYGYWAVAILVGLESVGIPLPGETILIAASAYAASHDGSVAQVIAVATLGAVVGDNIGYLVGVYLGRPFLLQYGKYAGITGSRIKLGQYLFARYGTAIVFFGRFMAVLRCLAALLAGVNRLAWPRFLLANAAGALVWSTTISLTASMATHHLRGLHGPAAGASFALAAAVAGAVFWYLRRHEATLQAAADQAFPGPLQEERPGSKPS